jgi:hypothetical protein
MKTVLIVNHKEKQCGIHQYGEDIYEALKKSTEYNFRYAECLDERELRRAIFRAPQANAVIYNYYPFTMPWLNGNLTRDYAFNSCKIKHLGIMHEVTREEADKATNELFDYWLCPDPTLITENPLALRTKRLIPPYINKIPLPDVPTIGSFGFGFSDKGFERIVTVVQDEFDKAVIRFLMPVNPLVGTEYSIHNPMRTAKRCEKILKNTDIKLDISHQFLDKKGVLDFLAGNTVNCFFYDVNKDKGISSVIDYALAVHRPIALTKCGMFRHMFSSQEIFIENCLLEQIIFFGTEPQIPYTYIWSEKAFIEDYERILGRVL